jgi:hypothetical protein
LELLIVNTRKKIAKTQVKSPATTQEIPDSLGVISFQEVERSPKHLTYPLQSLTHPVAPIDTATTLAPIQEISDSVAISAPLSVPETNTALIQPPFTHRNSFAPDFSISLFDHAGALPMNLRNFGAQPTLSQDFKEKVFVINYKKINDTSNNWAFWLIFGCLALLCFARIRYRKQFNSFLSSIFHYNLLLKTIRNGGENTKQLSTILQILFSINTSLFLYQTVNYFLALQVSGLQNMAWVGAGAVVLFLLYVLKSAFLRALGGVYQQSSYVQKYLFNVFLYNKAIGLFLFPVVICFAFVQPHIIGHGTIIAIGVALIAFFYLLRIIRGVSMSLKSGISPFYILLFICLLEFLPLALLAKITTIVLNSLSL